MNPVNFGNSSRLSYDNDTYKDKLTESVAPANYKLNNEAIYNRQQCLSTLGPRTSYMGNSVSTTVGFPPAVALTPELVDISSILSNRNMKLSNSKNGKVNDIDVTKYKLEHLDNCNNFLDTSPSRLTNPTQNYRDMAINRFYNLERNPQEAIFWNFSINTKLEAIDNFESEMPILWKTKQYP